MNFLTVPRTIYAFFLALIVSFFLAYLEIQVEGTQGWARNLPTWRKNVKGFQFTGYHLSLWIFILLLAHLPFVFVPWSLRAECFILSFYVLILLLEDCLWFLMNDQFCGNDDWRNPKLGPVPMFFFIGAFFVLLMALGSRSLGWFISCLVLLLGCLISFPFQVKSCPTTPSPR